MSTHTTRYTQTALGPPPRLPTLALIWLIAGDSSPSSDEGSWLFSASISSPLPPEVASVDRAAEQERHDLVERTRERSASASTHIRTSLSIYLSIYPSIHPSIHPSVYSPTSGCTSATVLPARIPKSSRPAAMAMSGRLICVAARMLDVPTKREAVDGESESREEGAAHVGGVLVLILILVFVALVATGRALSAKT